VDGTKAVIGAVAGLLVAVGLVTLIGASPPNPNDETTTAETTTTTPATAIPWRSPDETVFESTVLIPGDVVADDGTITLDYELESLGPGHGAALDASNVDASPDRWEILLISGGGTVVETEIGARSVTFELRSGVTLEHVAAINLIGWRAAVPVGETIVLDVRQGAGGAFAGGTTVTVETVLEQANSVIVQLAIDQPRDEWDRIGIDAVDPGWRESGRDGGIQYIWDRGAAPEVIELVQSTPTWVPIAGTRPVYVGDES